MSHPENPVDAPDPSPSGESATATATAPLPEAPRRRPGAAGRRRLVWGLIVVLVGAAVGAGIGWSSEVPIYESRALVYIEPSMPSPEDPGGQRVLPLFQAFVAAQVQLLYSDRTTRVALEAKPWQQVEPGAGESRVAAFEARREIVHQPGTHHVEIRYRHPRPEVAQAGARALVHAYQQMAREVNDADDRIEYARTNLELLEKKTQQATREILRLTSEYGGVEGLEVRHLAVVEQVLEAERELERIRQRLARLAARDRLPVCTPEEIAVESEPMAEQLEGLARLHAEAELLAERVAEDHPSLVALRARIRVQEERIARYAEEWNRARRQEANAGEDDDALRAAEAALAARLEALREQSRKLGRIRADVERLNAETGDLRRQLAQMDALRDQLEAQLTGSGRIKVFDPGSLPQEPWRDDRTLYAWIGGLVGGLGALALFLLVVAVSRRLGWAADADAYHARVRAAIELLPKRIGEWRSHEVALPPAAARLPRPNVVVGREFQNPSTGEHATLRIVQCRDARDLSAWYPPIQYPADGWTLREAEPRHLPALLAAIPGTVYRFTRESAHGSSEVLVYNFFARPDGSIESGPAGALHDAAETHTQALGAAQFQILLGPTMARDRRDEVFRTLIAAALPVMDALCVEDEEQA